MTNTDMIKELRALTQAGMKDCKDALEEANWDLQKAVDIVKVKGLAFADGRSGRVASDGLIDIVLDNQLGVMIEINCQTDFVANGKEFSKFVFDAKHKLYESALANVPFDVSELEAARKDIVASTKENVVIRRWWVEQSMDSTVRVFGYEHSNRKIGVLITMKAPNETAANSPEFKSLGEDLAMQICAMNPLAVSSDRLSSEDSQRQGMIFRTQLAGEKKPEKMWDKILEGKMNKWFKEVCLLEQESVVVPKTSVKQVIKNVGIKLGGEIQVINFIRCQVGEGIEQKQSDLAEEVAKLM